MSKLLINEHPLQLLPTLASTIGLEKAVALQQLHYRQKWLQDEKIESHRIDGKYWVMATYAEWKEKDFPFWNEAKIGRVLRSIENLPFIESQKHNKANWNHGKSYHLNYAEFYRWESELCTFDNQNIDDLEDSNIDDLHIKENLRETGDISEKQNIPAHEILGKEKCQYDNTRMTKEEVILAASGANKPEPFASYPSDVIPYLRIYAEEFREPHQDETKKGIATDWVKTVRVWISRQYTVENLRKAAKHAKAQEMTVSRPGSLTWAFDEIEIGEPESQPREKIQIVLPSGETTKAIT